MTETDIEDCLDELAIIGSKGGGDKSDGDEGTDGPMLGLSDCRAARFSSSIGNYEASNFFRNTWIPYCNNLMCESSDQSYSRFCHMYKMKSTFPTEVTSWFGLFGRIREAGIQAFLKARKMSPSFRLFNAPLDKLIFDIISEWKYVLFVCTWFMINSDFSFIRCGPISVRGE